MIKVGQKYTGSLTSAIYAHVDDIYEEEGIDGTEYTVIEYTCYDKETGETHFRDRSGEAYFKDTFNVEYQESKYRKQKRELSI